MRLPVLPLTSGALPALRLLPVLVALLAVAPAVLAADAPASKATAATPAAKVLKAPRGPLADGQARVAQGVMVPHYGSAWRASELAALRPDYADLKPRARTNKE